MRRVVPLAVLVLLFVGFLVLTLLSLLPLVPGAQRTLAFTSQDIPPYVRYASFSVPFWMRAGESVKPDLVDTAYNETSGAMVWHGPAYVAFLHQPLNQTGPAILFPSTASADGYYALEVHHNDCQSEVELCAVPSEGVVFQTQGAATFFSPRPYPFLLPSAAVLAEVASLAGVSLSAWYLVQWRSHQASRLRDIAKLAFSRPLVLILIIASMIVASVGGVNLFTRSQLMTEVRGMGSIGFARESPCVRGQANPMLVYVWAYNGADEYVTIHLGVIIAGRTYPASGMEVWPHSWMGTGALYTSYDCKDPAAQVQVLSATPQWL